MGKVGLYAPARQQARADQRSACRVVFRILAIGAVVLLVFLLGYLFAEPDASALQYLAPTLQLYESEKKDDAALQGAPAVTPQRVAIKRPDRGMSVAEVVALNGAIPDVSSFIPLTPDELDEIIPGVNSASFACDAACGPPSGTCWLGRCWCEPGWTGKPSCQEREQKPVPSCIPSESTSGPRGNTFDLCYWSTEHGIARVPRERWERAQAVERALWSNMGGSNDRSDAHEAAFNGYRMIPDQLGDVIELGCGPWTQLEWMLQKGERARGGWRPNITSSAWGEGRRRRASGAASRDPLPFCAVSLADPGMPSYMTSPGLVCAYRGGTLAGRPVSRLYPVGVEGVLRMCGGKQFDTVVMIK